ncbi:MAG: hypothetical protein ACYDDF_01745 [Thermoplasmatota archaeon]
MVCIGLAFLGLPVPVLALYRRIEKPDVMEESARRRIYEHVAREPGLTAARIAELEGFDRKTVAHHARVLHRHALLTVSRDGKALRYYLPGARADPPPVAGVAADLLRLALAEPGLPQSAAASRLGVCRATVQWHARRLSDRGLLERGVLRVAREKEPWIRDALAADKPPAA